MSISTIQDICGVTAEVAQRALAATHNSTETAIDLLLAGVAINELEAEPANEEKETVTIESTKAESALVDTLTTLFPHFEQFFLEFLLNKFDNSIDSTVDYLLAFQEKDEVTRTAEIEQARAVAVSETSLEEKELSDIERVEMQVLADKGSPPDYKKETDEDGGKDEDLVSRMSQLMNEEGLFIVESSLLELEIKKSFLDDLLTKSEFSDEMLSRLKYTGTDVGYPEELLQDVNKNVLATAKEILIIVNDQISEVKNTLEKITTAVNDRKHVEELLRKEKEEEERRRFELEQTQKFEVWKKCQENKKEFEKDLSDLMVVINKTKTHAIAESESAKSSQLVSLFPFLIDEDALLVMRKYDNDLNTCIEELTLLQKAEINHVFLPYTRDFFDLVNYRKKNAKSSFKASQSTKGVTSIPTHLSSAGRNKYCFETMLDLEYHFQSDFYIFYHSFSYSLLLYEVNTVLAQEIFGVPKHFPPLPRLFFKAFDSMIETQMLVEEARNKNNDNGVEYRDTTLSVSNSIFAFSSEAPPISVFSKGYSCTDISFRGILNANLIECGMDKNTAEKTTEELVQLAKTYKIDYGVYTGRASSMYCDGSGGMLQIFVKKEDADYISYISQAFGRVEGIETKPSKYFENKHIDGQARLFVHPRYFVLERRAMMFYYHTKPELSFGENRQGLLNDIRSILKVLYNTPEVKERTRRRIMGVSMEDDQINMKELHDMKTMDYRKATPLNSLPYSVKPTSKKTDKKFFQFWK